GWSYLRNFIPPGPIPGGRLPPGSGSTPAMTCAGLIGLAAGFGTQAEAAALADRKVPDLTKDKAIQVGLLALSTTMDAPPPENPRPGPPSGPPNLGSGGFNAGPRTGRIYYFLWSLERVAVTFGLEKIADKDWYAWGCDFLLRSQGSD